MKIHRIFSRESLLITTSLYLPFTDQKHNIKEKISAWYITK